LHFCGAFEKRSKKESSRVTALDFILSCMLLTGHLAFLNIQLNPQELEELNAFIFQTELSLQKWEPVIKSRELDVLKGVFYASKAVFLMTTKPEEATFWAKESIKFLSSVKKLELIVSISLLCATTVCKVGGEMEAAQEGLALLDSFTLPFTKLLQEIFFFFKIPLVSITIQHIKKKILVTPFCNPVMWMTAI